MHQHRSPYGFRRRAAIGATLIASLLALAGCGGSGFNTSAPITSLRELADCWTDFGDPLHQVLCFNGDSDVVSVERGDGYGNIVCNGQGEAAILRNRLVVVQENLPGACLDGTVFTGQFVECDLTISTQLGMYCKRRLGEAVTDPNAGEQYVLTRL